MRDVAAPFFLFFFLSFVLAVNWTGFFFLLPWFFSVHTRGSRQPPVHAGDECPTARGRKNFDFCSRSGGIDRVPTAVAAFWRRARTYQRIYRRLAVLSPVPVDIDVHACRRDTGDARIAYIRSRVYARGSEGDLDRSSVGAQASVGEGGGGGDCAASRGPRGEFAQAGSPTSPAEWSGTPFRRARGRARWCCCWRYLGVRRR